jgi:hypothetical protein
MSLIIPRVLFPFTAKIINIASCDKNLSRENVRDYHYDPNIEPIVQVKSILSNKLGIVENEDCVFSADLIITPLAISAIKLHRLRTFQVEK